jgi:hypothetical protein
MFEVQISEDALADFDDAIKFYSEISPELGRRFVKNFDITVLQLETFPFFQKRYDEIRIRQVNNFPVLIHYILNKLEKTIVIHGVRFAKSNPENYPNI